MKSAQTVLTGLIEAIDEAFAKGETAQDISLGVIDNIASHPAEYREYLLEQRNLAIAALNELGISHKFHVITDDPDISPVG